MLQAGIGCLNHRHIAPSRPGMCPVASLTYLVYGSTTLWLHCYTAFSFLPFPLELLKAALCCMVLLASSPHLCATSWGLRAGYATLHAGVTRAAQCGSRALMDAVSPTLGAAAMAATAGISDTRGESASLPLTVGASQQEVDSAVCLQYQTPVLLLFGFVASTWAVHRAERCLRTKFLLSCCGRQQQEGQGTATQQQHQSREQPPPPQQPQHPQQSNALQAAATQELAGPLPNDLDFLICIALPAMFFIVLLVAL
jgi:hypothetical protein